MKIEKRANCLTYEKVFPGNVVAGTTLSPLRGGGPGDVKNVLSELGVSAGTACLDQPHGGDVVTASGSGDYQGDGAFTGQEDLAVCVRTADCLPLLFCDGRNGIIGAVHMGWRSAEAGILDNIPYEMNGFRVVAGPGLRGCCFEVGEEFGEKEEMRRFLVKREDKYLFDAASFAKKTLVDKGLSEGNFFDTGLCSFCSSEGLYSFRKDGARERNLSFIVRASGAEHETDSKRGAII